MKNSAWKKTLSLMLKACGARKTPIRNFLSSDSGSWPWIRPAWISSPTSSKNTDLSNKSSPAFFSKGLGRHRQLLLFLFFRVFFNKEGLPGKGVRFRIIHEGGPGGGRGREYLNLLRNGLQILDAEPF